MVRRFLCTLLFFGAAHAQQWEPSLASPASLRTGGASLASSDAVALDDGNLALITYWEVRTSRDLDVYRCIDVVDSAFVPVSQRCWSALRPTGRGPVTIDGVFSSNDICGRPDDLGDLSEAAYCSFSKPMKVRTPYFELVIEPFEDEGLVAVVEEGRSLVLTSPPWPSSVYLEVRATNKEGRPFFADVSSATEIPDKSNDDTQCTAVTVFNRIWAACRSRTSPGTATSYLIDNDLLYEATYTADLPESFQRQVDSILATLEPVRPK
jgi:hypothetical protein